MQRSNHDIGRGGGGGGEGGVRSSETERHFRPGKGKGGPPLHCEIFFFSGAFLIPYVSFLLLGGIPLFFMELSIGQILQAGPVMAWNKLSRVFSGEICRKQLSTT